MLTGAAAILALIGGCGLVSDQVNDDDGDSTMSYQAVKTSADELLATILPALASGVGGEFPLVRAEFLGCRLGPPSFQYSVRGELHSQVVDDVQAANSIRDVLTAAGLDVVVEDDQTVVASIDGTEVVVLRGLDIGGARVSRSFSLDTECRSYSGGDADTIDEIPAETYGKPPTSGG
jgi:hypothetical protein